MSGTAKIPENAFALYVSLGQERSYQKVADQYGVSKRAMVKHAVRDKWSERLAEIEAKTRALTDAKLSEDLHAMDLRHRQLLRAVAARAAKAISEFPLNSGMEGIKAAEVAIKLERLLAGQPIENSHVSVERITKDEISRFLTTEPEDDWGDAPLEGTDGDDEQAGDEAASG